MLANVNQLKANAGNDHEAIANPSHSKHSPK